MTPVFTGTVDNNDIFTLTELKNFLRVENSVDNDLILALRDAAILYVEEVCNTKLGAYTATFYMDYFRHAIFPVGPVTAIASVYYMEATATKTFVELSANNYFSDFASIPARISFNDPPSVAEDEFSRVKITGTVGHPVANIPQMMKSAMQLLIGHLYENRTAEIIGTISSPIQLGVHALLSPYRVIWNR